MKASPLSIAFFLQYLEPILSALVIWLLAKSGAFRQFAYLTALLAVRLISSLTCLLLIYFGTDFGMSKHLAYKSYFYVYWSSYALESVLALMVIYSIFMLAMAPLKGLQRLGILVFRWVGAISAAVAIGVVGAPHLSGPKLMVAMFTQVQQTSSILTLCLLLFVCFAIRPMGLSYKSRVFGVSFGLGFMASTSLILSAWLSHNSTMYSTISMVNGIVVALTFSVWTAYFGLPEPKRRVIMLPTTSPFLRWNQISEILGDEPGFVAIAGFPPELFAPAEVEIMIRASAKMGPDAIESPPGLDAISA